MTWASPVGQRQAEAAHWLVVYRKENTGIYAPKKGISWQIKEIKETTISLSWIIPGFMNI